MFSSRKKNASSETSAKTPPLPQRKIAPSVISADMNILGNIHSDGLVDIDGKIDGNIRCAHATVRSNGRVKGDITAEQVTIYGNIEGLIKAKTVILHDTANVQGIIMHESLSIDDGAFVDGKFKRMDKVFIDEDAASSMLHEPSLEDLIEDSLTEPDEAGLDASLRLIN